MICAGADNTMGTYEQLRKIYETTKTDDIIRHSLLALGSSRNTDVIKATVDYAMTKVCTCVCVHVCMCIVGASTRYIHRVRGYCDDT
jgi:hypothetical protein